jgi:hypothetical protein
VATKHKEKKATGGGFQDIILLGKIVQMVIRPPSVPAPNLFLNGYDLRVSKEFKELHLNECHLPTLLHDDELYLVEDMRKI